MTTEQRILQIEAELALLKADLAKQVPTLERQPVKEPARDWEILEFKRLSDQQLFYRKGNGCYVNSKLSNTGILSLDEMLHDDTCVDSSHYIIHSVRRLSDGEVFAVGDNATMVGKENAPQIKKFEIFGDTMCAIFFDIAYDLMLLIKAVPLHTTADGIQVTKDQKLYSFLSSGDIETHPTWEDASYKYSSEEAARIAFKTWLYSQPVLTIDDIAGKQFGDIVDLVQQKLNTK